MLDLGTVRPGSTIYIPVNTFDSNDPSASVTITNWANTDCHVHKDGGTTQRTSSSGETLSIDFDSITGNHMLAIDLSDNTDANFYEAGSTYHVRIEGTTVDGATINAWIAQWRIGYPGAILDTVMATRASATSFTLEEGSADDDAYNGWVCVIHDLASAVQVELGYISDYTGSTKTVTLAADPGVFVTAEGDNISLFPPSNVAAWNNVPLATTNPLPNAAADAAGGLPISDAGGYDIDAITLAAIQAEAEDALETYGLDYLILNAVPTDLDTDVHDDSLIAHIMSDGIMLGWSRATHSLKQIAEDIAVVDGIADDILLDTGTTLDGKIDTIDGIVDTILVDTAALNDTKIPDTISLANIKTQMDASLSDIHLDHVFAVTYDPASKPGVADALFNELIEDDGGVSRYTANALEQGPGGGSGLSSLTTGTAQGGAAGSITLAAGESASDTFFDKTRILLTGGTGAGQSRLITGYTGATKVALVDRDWVSGSEPDATTTYEVQAADSSPNNDLGFSYLITGALPTDLDTDVHDDSVFGYMMAPVSTLSFDRTTDSLEEIRDAVDLISSTLSGSGADAVTMTITEGGNPVADADVWITNDAAGANVVAGTLQTNSSGEVTFMLDAGDTYYLWMQKDGVNSILGESFVAVAD